MQKTEKRRPSASALIYFPPPLNDYYAGIFESHDGSKFGGNYYHVAFDDGDEGGYT